MSGLRFKIGFGYAQFMSMVKGLGESVEGPISVRGFQNSKVTCISRWLLLQYMGGLIALESALFHVY